MFLACIVGAPGTGKTTFLKQFLTYSQKKIIFDVTGEFSKYESDSDFEIYYEKDKLLQAALSQKNCIILIDESTAFFSYRGYDSDLQKIVQLRRHNNHIILMCYHALKFIPEYLRPLINFIVAFQTGDNTDVLKNFPYIKKPLPVEKFKFNYYNQY
ncbi:MAG: ATP-binding protein [Bacteroidales bacterium]|nr:ATP-binding protein [Bacteroidales bacterium]